MDAETIKDGLDRLLQYIPVTLPATGWSFAQSEPADRLRPDATEWKCMFGYLGRISGGEPVCFSAAHTGCSGASCYLGFKGPSKDAGRFLAVKEGFKKDAALGNAFYEAIGSPAPEAEFLIWEPLYRADDRRRIEVVNLWVDADSLTALVTLANYDRPGNDAVIVPFASGCQSIWTIPYKERLSEEPRGVVGCMDPAVRGYLHPYVVSFSVPAERFMEMAKNVSGSFLEKSTWKSLMDRRRNSGT